MLFTQFGEAFLSVRAFCCSQLEILETPKWRPIFFIPLAQKSLGGDDVLLVMVCGCFTTLYNYIIMLPGMPLNVLVQKSQEQSFIFPQGLKPDSERWLVVYSRCAMVWDYIVTLGDGHQSIFLWS